METLVRAMPVSYGLIPVSSYEKLASFLDGCHK